MMPDITHENSSDKTSANTTDTTPEIIPEATPETVHAGPPKNRWQRLLHWEFFGLAVIVLITMVFHFVAITRPPTIVWDEVWYVGDARSILSGNGDIRPEHPPLGKLYIIAGDIIFNGFKSPAHDTGAQVTATVGTDSIVPVSDASKFTIHSTIQIGTEQMEITGIDFTGSQLIVQRGTSISAHLPGDKIFVFTDSAFGWRFFSVLLGTIGIILFYLICRKMKFSWKACMIATFLFAFENMTFIHSGLALLDVYMVTFMLAAVLMYLDEKYVLMGIFIALSAECKIFGVLIFIAIFLHWAIYRKDKWKEFSIGLVTAAISFVVFLVLFDFLLTGQIENPILRINALLSGTAGNKFSIPKLSISSRPWTWLYPQWVDIKNQYNFPFILYSSVPQYISFISTTIQLLILPTIGYMIYKVIKKNQMAAFVVLWFVATYVVWIPLDIVTNRTTYVFYFLATTPAICLGISIAISDWMEHLRNRRLTLNRTTPLQRTGYIAICLYLLLHLAIFVVFNPAIPVFIHGLPPYP
jgi:dolichyl-phosphate-mannose--protein O-mannosyl transferase